MTEGEAHPGADSAADGFDRELEAGAELLASGNLERARDALARARELRPHDPKALGLLGQAFYKLARFDDAAEVYAALVELSPAEAGARVNLALAKLKAKRYADAVRQLELALELSPDHRKAMNYLGLAWLEQGSFQDAREWFRRAGSHSMMARCDELLAGERAAEPPPEEPPSAEPISAEPLSRNLEVTLPGEPAPPLVSRQLVEAEELARAGPERALSASAAARLGGLTGEGTFAFSGGLLATVVRQDALVREAGLLAARGAVLLQPEMKRFRGKATDKPFGEGARRMLRASGRGELLHRFGSARLTALDLTGQAGYFREEVVFGIEGSVAFENGRVASPSGPDVSLVHLRGPGQALLLSAGELSPVDVEHGAPLRVVLSALVGWMGALTPRVDALVGTVEPDARASPLAVELSGEGRVLVDVGGAATPPA